MHFLGLLGILPIESGRYLAFAVCVLAWLSALPCGAQIKSVEANEKNGLQNYDVEEFRTQSEQSSDDTALINRAIEKIQKLGGGTLRFDGSRNYKISRANKLESLGGIILRPTVNLDGSNATITLVGSSSWFYYAPEMKNHAFVQSDVAAGDDSLHVDDTSSFNIGDSVYYRLGEESSDFIESNYFGWAKITAKTPSKLVFDAGFPRGLKVGRVTNKYNRSVLLVQEPLDRVSIRNFRLVVGLGGNPEIGIYLNYARNVLVENIRVENPGAGALACQYCEDVHVRNVDIISSKSYGAASKGRGFTFAETKNAVVEMVSARQLDNVLLFAEASSNVVMRNVFVENKNKSKDYVLLFAGQESSLDVSDLNVRGSGGFVLANTGGSRGWITVRNIDLDVSEELVSLGVPGSILKGRLIYRVAGKLEHYNLDRPVYSVGVSKLEDNMYKYVFLAPGIIGRIELFKSDNLTKNDLVDITVALGRRSPSSIEGDSGVDLTAFIAAGITSIPNTTSGTNGGALWRHRALPAVLLVATRRRGFNRAEKEVTIRLTSYVDELGSAVEGR